MARYRLVLEIEDLDGYSEERIDKSIRDGLETLAITVIDSKPFEKIGEEKEELFKELQEKAEDNIEVSPW